MPLSSVEIAQLNGAYQGAAMNNLAYANAIGMSAVPGQGVVGDRMMASAMSHGAAIGAPLAMGAMGLVGLDPMSIGLRAGMTAFRGGAGLGGGLAAGAMAAAPMALAFSGAQYAGSQMFTGAQQQMALNNSLRGSFNFQNRTTGMTGFAGSEMAQIGGVLREMSHQFGPAGEVTGMRELTQMATRMGQMGFANGVRDVQEFSKRFKGMIDALKTMARDLGTTMEGAMEFASAAKGSGIFGMGRVGQFASAVRGASVAGGLAVSEVTGAASVGSQIARSVGGLGRQGAMAGIRTIGQIGTAQEMGILSEEDIYNATGLTGADGRMALSSSQMQRAGSWLRSGRGRRLLASLAEKDGTLNEANVQQLLTGGMSISETMSLDRTQLAKVGRANFIRNEGRLRGAVLERFGGFIPAMQLQQWAQEKGIDINNMDDRSMLFAQRQLGMGRDEIDTAIKMASNMPQILERMRTSSRDDAYFQKMAQARKSTGLEGVHRRLEQARETVEGHLQKVGQDFFNSGSELIDRFVNQLSNTYVETYSKELNESIRSVQSGGAMGQASARSAFGVGMGSALGGATGIGGGAGPGLVSRLSRGSMGNDVFSMGYLLRGQSDMGRLKSAGFDLSGMDDAGAARKLREIEGVTRAISTSYSEGDLSLGNANRGWLRDQYINGKVTGSGDDRIKAFGALMNQAGGDLKARWESARTPEARAALMAGLERGAGITGTNSLSKNYGLPEGLTASMLGGKFATVGAENAAHAKYWGIEQSKAEKFAAGLSSQFLAGGLAGPLGALAGHALTPFASEFLGHMTGSKQTEQSFGNFMKGDEFRSLAVGLLTNDNATYERLQSEVANDKAPEEGTAEYGGYLAKKRMYEAAKTKRETGKETEDYGHMQGELAEHFRKQRAEASKRIRETSKNELDLLASNHVYDAASGKVSAETYKGLSREAAAYVQDSIGSVLHGAGMGDSVEDFQNMSLGATQRGSVLAGLSIKEKREVAKRLAGTDAGSEAGRSAAFSERFQKSIKRNGTGKALSQMLGLDLTKEELAGLDFSKNPDAAAQFLASRAGIGSDSEAVKQISRAARGGKGADEAMRQVLEGASLSAANEKKRLSQQEAEDPLQKAIKENGEKANKFLEALVRKSGAMTAELEALNKKNTDNPEGGPKK